MLRTTIVTLSAAACLSFAASAQEDAPPELPPEAPPTLPDQPPPVRKAKKKKEKAGEQQALPELPDLGQILDAPPEITATRPDGKKIVALAWQVYAPDSKEKNELDQVLRSLIEQKANIQQLPPGLIRCEPNQIGCIVALAGTRDLDVILFGQINKVENGFSASIRAIAPDPVDGKKERTGRVIAQTDQNLDSKAPAHVRAWAEAIACRLKLQASCSADFQVSADLPEFRLFIDNVEQPKPFQPKGAPKAYTAPVGVHDARVMFGQNTSLEHKLPIATAFEAPVLLYARRLDKGGLVLQLEDEFPKEMDGSIKIPASVPPKPFELKPTRIAGIAAMGAGVLAAGFAAYEGSHGKSLQNGANDAYKSRGAYTQADVGNLNSGASAIKTGNTMFLVAGGLAAVGAVLFFAF